ncbi:5'-AMP-activated protein kinase subunit gamma-3 isoform X3 [Lutra lutra]|uniref:5'-AMP-activated protein kinase subunit gamma-3 isoform X3 n=1 Tax=Lutra lutra TaxID=9657 RepID=UPI001FD3DBF3|nr:5'-AMP-activated protein kinase subunit gamma-3 isoform X3 [Lutra lutra]
MEHTLCRNPSWSHLGGPEHQEMSFLEQGENTSWPSPAMSTGSERSHGKQGTKASRWTRQEAVEERELLGLGEDPTDSQARPPAEYAGLEATFPEATHLSQAAPLARLGSAPTEWDIFPSDDVASTAGSSTDGLELDLEFPATGAWGYELGMVEERPALCPSPRALLPKPGWDDELQKPGAQVYMRFMQEHTCYDAMATSSKLVIFDTTLEVQIHEIEEHKIETWREIYLQGCFKPLVSISPNSSLFEAVYILIKNRIHRLPVLDPVSGAVLHILTHKRLLKFLHIFGALLPQPSFLSRTIQDLGIGTFRDLAVVLDTAPILTALDIFVDRRVSALPVINEAGQVVGLYSRFDVIHLAAQQTYNHLDISVREALKQRTLCLEGVLSCQPHESLGEVIDRIVREQVHRLVLVDESQHLLGIVSLSDILQALVLSPAGIDALGA